MGRVIETKVTTEDKILEKSLRPLRLSEYIGQDKITDWKLK